MFIYITMASFDMTKFSGVMFFYMMLTYIVCTAVGYLLFGRTVEAAGNGFIFGSIVSIILWKIFGIRIVKGEIMKV
jgi:hypothetical protein